MVRRLTSSGAGVEVVVGKAGAGKTLALAAARVAWESDGHRVLGTALSARAARGLSDGAGIESDTLARTMTRISAGSLALGAHDVIVLDEAVMVGTRALAALVQATEAAGAKLVLVGDPRQLPEIEAGGALAALADRLGVIELTENRRQHEQWERQALDALRLGHAASALATYERAGRVHTAPNQPEARAQLVERWVESFTAGDDAVMLAFGRAEVAQLNDAARVLLRDRGHLGSDVLEQGDLGFALSDKVVCLRNDRRLGVLNGTVGMVARAHGGGLVIATSDGARTLSPAYLEAGHLGHGYALTVHKAQGLTVERAYVLASEALTQEAGYVAMSRARQGTELFVSVGKETEDVHDPRQVAASDPLADVTRRLASSRAKSLALTAVETNAPEITSDVTFDVIRNDEALTEESSEPRTHRAPRATSTPPKETASEDDAYRLGQIRRGVGDGTSMDAQAELSPSTGSGSTGAGATDTAGSLSDIARQLDDQRRAAVALARQGWRGEIDGRGRDRGRSR